MRKADMVLSIVALITAFVALGVVANTHRSLSNIPHLEECYTYKTHTFSGELARAAWFAGGTVFYYYKDGEDEVSWVDVPWRQPLESLNQGDIITITKEYKMASSCLAGRVVSVSNLAMDEYVVGFSIRKA